MTVKEYKERIAELEKEVEELKLSLCNAKADADYRHFEHERYGRCGLYDELFVNATRLLEKGGNIVINGWQESED